MPYTECDDEVREIVQTVLKNWHITRLYLDSPKQIKIGCIFYVPKESENGEPGPPLKLHGYAAAAIVKPTSEKQRAQGMADVTIIIDSDQWKDLSEESRIALMDHELEHLERVMKKSVPADDDLGRPRLKNKLHDWQLGGFRCIAERHRQHALEVYNARQFADEYGQMLFGFAGKKIANDGQSENLATSVPVAKAMKEFVEGIGAKAGFDSIEISSGGTTVTIDKPAADRVRKNCDAVINDAKKKKRNVA